MALKLTSSQKILMGIASAGAAFVLYDQVVNFGPARSSAAEHGTLATPLDAAAPVVAAPAPVVNKPRAAELLMALRTRMDGATGGSSSGSLRDVFAPIAVVQRPDAARTSDHVQSPDSISTANAARAEQLARLFVLRSVLQRAGTSSATVNDAVLMVGRPARLRVGEGTSAREYTLVLESVQEPGEGDRGSAVLLVNDERITLHIRE